jgi:Fic family protein
MGNLEKFLHDQPQRTPALLKAALAHVQFETIHPFLDGNGRLGRLLVTLILCAEDALAQPLLYLSLFLKQHRQEYYDRLDAVRLKGDWLGWLRFFLEGVEQTAQQAADTAGRILKLFEEDRRQVEGLGRPAGSAHRVFDLLRRRPVTTIPNATVQLHLTPPTVRSAVESLETLGIVREITGKQRDRIYLYDRYVRILDEGTEPLPRGPRA